MTSTGTSSLALTGLDGSNPLGFLAALGTFRVFSLAQPEKTARLHWKAAPYYQPVLTCDETLSADMLLDAIAKRLAGMAAHPALTVDDNLKLSPETFRAYAKKAVEQAHASGDRTWPDFVAAFGCEATSEDGVIQDTAFRTMSGAGHQHFLKTMRDLARLTTRDHLYRSLFEPWAYEDEKPSLRWDPADDRRYALRWKEPSGDPIRTQRGANRLAVEALPLFPTAPVHVALETTGFQTGGSRHTFFTWPIWNRPVTLDVVRSLLALPELQSDQPPRRPLRAMGIVDVYRSQRLTIGKFRNFAPARSV